MYLINMTEYEKSCYPSIHYTGSITGMKKLGSWGKHDKCVRSGRYIYNISKPINIYCDPLRYLRERR